MRMSRWADNCFARSDYTHSFRQDLHGGEEQQLPPEHHVFDLDGAPLDEEIVSTGDDFDADELELDEDEDDEEAEEDSAFASSIEDGDAEMADGDDNLPPPHLRPNPIPTLDDEDGAITTNLEDDLENEGYTLPAVDRGGEAEAFEHGTSLREVEGRMRWLVKVCMGKDEKVSNGVPGK